MEDNRKNLQKHIRAASDWLQQADKSIERKEDLKGDLKLMLAKAELQNAEKHQNRSRLTKIFSFATAVLIALAISWVNDDSETISQLSTPSVANTTVPDSPIVEKNKSTDSSFSTDIPKEEIFASQNQQQTQVPYEQPPTYENTESETVDSESITDLEVNTQPYYSEVESEPIAEDLNIYSESISDVTSESTGISSEAQAPTEDMQKLMQSAGQILHAE